MKNSILELPAVCVCCLKATCKATDNWQALLKQQQQTAAKQEQTNFCFLVCVPLCESNMKKKSDGRSESESTTGSTTALIKSRSKKRACFCQQHSINETKLDKKKLRLKLPVNSALICLNLVHFLFFWL